MTNPKKKLKSREINQRPRIASPDFPQVSLENQTAVFSFEYCDHPNKNGYKKCTGEELISLIKTLNLLSKQTWNQLKNSNYKNGGYEKIQYGFKGELPNSVREKNIIAFRFHKKKPMIGFRDKRVFFIIWLDRKMKLYKH